MKIPVKKLKNGFAMPVYGLGTWQMGGRHNHDPHNDDQADIKAIQTALENGVTHFDTAEMYANGYAETLLGKAIAHFDRSKLLIASKVRFDFSYDGVLKAAEASLKRLGIDYLDLYYTHVWTNNVPIKETMRAMDKLVDEGLVKHIAVSNYTAEEIEMAQQAAKHKIVAAQLHYNLKVREPERKGVLKYCQENDIILVAWRPVQKGMLLENVPSVLQEMAEKYDKTPSQIAINWLISQKNIVTLSKTRNLEHLKENLGATGWEMDKEDVEKLRREFPDQEDISNVEPLK